MEFVLSVDNENMADDPNSVDSVEATFAVQLGACIKFTETSNVDQFSHVVNLRFIFAAISTPQLPDELRHSFQKSLTKFFSLKNGARLLFAPELAPFILAGLTCHDDNLRQFTVLQFIGSAGDPEMAYILNLSGLLDSIMQCLFDNCIAVSKAATEVMILMLCQPDSHCNSLLRRVQQVLQQHTSNSNHLKQSNRDENGDAEPLSQDECSVRAFSLLLQACQQSERCCKDVLCGNTSPTISTNVDFVSIAEALFTTPLNLMTESEDILLSLNLTELLTEFALVPHGYNCLVRYSVVSRLLTMIHKHQRRGNGGMCATIVFRCVETMARSAQKFNDTMPSWFERDKFANIVSAFLENSSDKSSQAAAAYCLGVVCASTQLFIALCGELGSDLRLLSSMAILVRDPSDEVRIAGLHAMAEVMTPIHSITEADQTVLQGRIFAMIHPTGADGAMHICFDYMRTPFPDLRNAAFRLVALVARQGRWGIDVLRTQPGFLEWLTNRNTESDQSIIGNDWKYSIVQNLFENRDFCAADFPAHLATYYRQGRIYAPIQSSVMTMEL